MSSLPSSSVTRPAWVPSFFNDPMYDQVFAVNPDLYQEHATHLQQLIGLPQATFLDQCCGQGWLGHHLSQQGWSGVAVDQSLHAAKNISLRAPKDLRVVCADAGQYLPSTPVDVAINWHTSVGYGGQEGMQALLKQLFQSVHDQGHVVVELRHVDHYQEQSPYLRQDVHLPDGPASLWRISQWEQNTLNQTWKVMRNNRVLWEHQTSCYHPSLEELKSHMRMKKGKLAWYANAQQDPLLPQSPRMLLHWKGDPA